MLRWFLGELAALHLKFHILRAQAAGANIAHCSACIDLVAISEREREEEGGREGGREREPPARTAR